MFRPRKKEKIKPTILGRNIFLYVINHTWKACKTHFFGEIWIVLSLLNFRDKIVYFHGLSNLFDWSKQNWVTSNQAQLIVRLVQRFQWIRLFHAMQHFGLIPWYEITCDCFKDSKEFEVFDSILTQSHYIFIPLECYYLRVFQCFYKVTASPFYCGWGWNFTPSPLTGDLVTFASRFGFICALLFDV